MTITCAIVDDEPLAVELLASYCEKIPFLNLVGKFNNATEALRATTENQIDLLFLDIQMPQLNGLELSRMLPENTRVVFTTAFNQYALDGYRINALDYLLKPITYATFLEACNKALQWFTLLRQAEAPNDQQVRSIFVKSEYKLIQVNLEQLLYVEGLKDYVKIYTLASPHPILSLMGMKTMEQMLPQSRFIRVHRSYIVSIDKIREIDRNRIIVGQTEIPIGDSYKQAFQDFLSR